MKLKGLRQVLVCFAFLLSVALLHGAENKPNIVIFLADDSGWGDYSFAGLTNNPQSPAGTGSSLAQFLLGEVSSAFIDRILGNSWHAVAISGFFDARRGVALSQSRRRAVPSPLRPGGRWNVPVAQSLSSALGRGDVRSSRPRSIRLFSRVRRAQLLVHLPRARVESLLSRWELVPTR